MIPHKTIFREKLCSPKFTSKLDTWIFYWKFFQSSAKKVLLIHEQPCLPVEVNCKRYFRFLTINFEVRILGHLNEGSIFIDELWLHLKPRLGRLFPLANNFNSYFAIKCSCWSLALPDKSCNYVCMQSTAKLYPLSIQNPLTTNEKTYSTKRIDLSHESQRRLLKTNVITH